MSKKKKTKTAVIVGEVVEWNKLSQLAGLKILDVDERNNVISLSNKVILAIEEEGSYSDYWTTSFSYRKVNFGQKIEKVFICEDGNTNTITITFVNENNLPILIIKHCFHNRSDWNYGCYVRYHWKNKGKEQTETFYI